MKQKLSIKEVEEVVYRLAKELIEHDEPIPDFTTRFPGILESTLVAPFQSFGRMNLYQGLVGKAAILFYLMVKNHPFQNGNKRIAMATLFYYLFKNGKWLKVDEQALYNFAVWVAQSPAELKEMVVPAVGKFFKKYLIDVKIEVDESV